MNPTCILQVEDEKADVVLFRFALAEAGISLPVQVAVDGQQAIDYLAGTGIFSNREKHPLPLAVLLDLHIPRVSGLDVLKWIRQQRAFHSLPVLVLSGSDDAVIKKAALGLGASACFVKPFTPSDRERLARYVKQILEQAGIQPAARPGSPPS